jgi:hypothetical protein
MRESPLTRGKYTIQAGNGWVPGRGAWPVDLPRPDSGMKFAIPSPINRQ